MEKSIIETLTIPSGHLKYLTEKWNNTNQTLFLIQDAYTIPAVQKKIADILKVILSRFKLSQAYVEGTEGNIDTSAFFAINNSKERNSLAEHYIFQGKITGVEWLSITQPDLQLKIFGVDDDKLHEQQHEVMRKILAQNEPVISEIDQILEHLIKMIKIANPAFHELLESGIKKDLKEIDFSEYIQYLLKTGNQHNCYVELFPNLNLFKQALEYENKNTFDITMQLKAKEIMGQIKIDQIMREIEEFSQMLFTRIADKSDNKKLLDLKNFVDEYCYLKDLFRIRVSGTAFTREQKKFYKKTTLNKKSFKALCKKFRLSLLEIDFDKIKTFRTETEEFYKLASQRSRIMHKNLLKHQKRPTNSILISGGYHTEMLKRYFEDSDFNVAIIAPSITKKDLTVNNYDNIMMDYQTTAINFLKKGEYANAIHLLEKIIVENKYHTEAYYFIAIAESNRGNLNKAAEYFKNTLDCPLDIQGVKKDAKNQLEQIESTNKLLSAYKEGESLFQQKAYNKALIPLKKVTSYQADSQNNMIIINAYYYLIQISLILNQNTEALNFAIQGQSISEQFNNEKMKKEFFSINEKICQNEYAKLLQQEVNEAIDEYNRSNKRKALKKLKQTKKKANYLPGWEQQIDQLIMKIKGR